MGNTSSRPAEAAPSFTSIRSDAKRADTNVQTEHVKILLQHVQTVTNAMKKEVEANNLIPTELFNPLFDALDSLHEIMNPERPNVCYIVGPADTGKSSTIDSVCRKQKCRVGHTDISGTTEFEVIPAPEANAIFVDTIGFGSNPNGDRDLLKEMQKQANIGQRPDAIVLVITKDVLRRERDLANMIKDLNKYLTWLKKRRSAVEVPVFCVLGKIDQYFNGELPKTEADVKQVNQYAIRALTTVNKYLIYPASRCVPVSARHDYGVEELRNHINAHSPLNAQIIDRNLNYLSRARPSIANKIIAAFSAASAAVSFIPIADIVLVTVLQEWMYRMLACFSVDPNRTPDSFKTVHRAQQLTSIGIRGAALFVGGALQLSVIGYLVGSAICVATASSSTAIMGWACYLYFTK